jgi:hypothetical protein
VKIISFALKACILFSVCTPFIYAQSSTSESEKKTQDELAKELANPVAPVITAPFQWNYDRGRGAGQAGTDQTLLFQPVIPTNLSGGDTFITRPIVTTQWLNNINGYTGAGMSNAQLETFYVPKSNSSWLWGIGPYLASSAGSSGRFGSNQTGAGASAIVLNRQGNWVYGLLTFQSWSVGGSPIYGTANNLYAQPFINFVTSTAWTYSLNTQSNYNYDARRMSNPMNFTISKLEKIGNTPTQFTVGARYNISSIPGGPQGWGARAAITFVIPQ